MESSDQLKQEQPPAAVERLPYKTYREYYEDSYRFQSVGNIQDFWKTDKENELAVVLDRTIFHPQGGGQPADEGFITSLDGSVKFSVKALQSKDDAILHIGSFEKDGDTFEKGQQVQLNVDEQKRRAFAKFHSAGHLLDIAMVRCGQTQLKPSKGYHFTSGAYVEYIGNVDNAIKDKLTKDLTEACNAIIREQKSEDGVWSQIVSYDEASKILKDGIPSYMPAGQDMRVIKLTEEDMGCPCGGTHVKHVGDIQQIEVTKIVKKGKTTRVSYTVKENNQ